MTFYWSRNVTLLFDSWKTDSWFTYSLTLIACLIFSVFYQYMEDRRLRFKLLSSSSTSTAAAVDGATTTTTTTPLLQTKLFAGSRWNLGRFAGSALFGINSALGYFLMLAIMSFNGGVFVAIVVGLAVGYLLFRSGGDDEQVVIQITFRILEDPIELIHSLFHGRLWYAVKELGLIDFEWNDPIWGIDQIAHDPFVSLIMDFRRFCSRMVLMVPTATLTTYQLSTILSTPYQFIHSSLDSHTNLNN
ncbi:hypothetical protein OSB04_014784 [Centaurea solstitialis]|uniref:Copper transport protein n=1 Tax=Centaurea solstitialis TaxID=347529 RepID=A0AA38SXR2_9ASTR|nr:hypothetical protein OSB04_014784 [Centaurea solstitialis]